MVNTGHPSRACKLCRARRIRCDETKPFCLKCMEVNPRRLLQGPVANASLGIKSKRVCPGYRDPFEINLRDETQATIRKAQAAHKKKLSVDEKAGAGTGNGIVVLTSIGDSPGWASSSHSDTSWDSQSSHSSPLTATSITDISGINTLGFELDSPSDGTILRVCPSEDTKVFLPPNLQTPLDQQAACFFFSQYVLMPARGPGRGMFTFLVSLLGKPETKQSPLPMAFAAVSLAALAGRPNSRGLLAQASNYYTRALKELNGALQSKEMAVKDTSLASVIMLSFYEVSLPPLSERNRLFIEGI
jgi:hypothetical protein